MTNELMHFLLDISSDIEQLISLIAYTLPILTN